MVADRDAFFMRKALRLAERGRGRTSPNPMVGALVVDADGVIVGRGAHEVAGGPHAEVYALNDARQRARGATLYCTLEPCSHHGRTGPCAPRVADAGIARVVAATEDPNPRVAGRGNAYLRARGITVEVGVLAGEARRLNQSFFTVMTAGRPFVTMKIALSLDGYIAAGGDSRTLLTGADANRHVHRERAEVDGIAVGSGTLLADDPLLTPRIAYRTRPLARVVFDGRLRTPPDARLFSTLETGPVIIVTSRDAVGRADDARTALVRAGATLDVLDDPHDLQAVLARLPALGVQSLIVEGGAALHQSFWDAGLVDRVQMFVASTTIGRGGIEWIPSPVIGSTAIEEQFARPLGQDVLIEAYVHRTH